MKWFKKRLEAIVEDDKKIKQTKLADEVAALTEKPKSLGFPFRSELLETCYHPVIQSGGTYNLKPSAQTEETLLHYDNGTIIVTIGYRFRNYCTNISRTFFFNATKAQRRYYKILTTCYMHILNKLKHGVRLCDIYKTAVTYISKVQ
eukprot:UN27141